MREFTSVVLCLGLAAAGGCSRATTDTVQASETAAPVETIPQGTSFRVRLQETLDTERNRAGDHFTAVLDEPLVSGDRVIVPKGTIFRGHITQSHPSGRFKGNAVMALKLDSFTIDGRGFDIHSSGYSRASAGHKKHAFSWIGGGAGGGAMIGAIAGGGAGALIGAGAGAAAGTVGSAVTGKREIKLLVETPIRFTLQEDAEFSR